MAHFILSFATSLRVPAFLGLRVLLLAQQVHPSVWIEVNRTHQSPKLFPIYFDCDSTLLM